MRKLHCPPFHKNEISVNKLAYVSFCGGGEARDWSIVLFAVRANNKIVILSGTTNRKKILFAVLYSSNKITALHIMIFILSFVGLLKKWQSLPCLASSSLVPATPSKKCNSFSATSSSVSMFPPFPTNSFYFAHWNIICTFVCSTRQPDGQI